MASVNIVLTACLVLTSTVPATAQESRWPLEGPVKTPSKALEVPTRLAPVSESLTAQDPKTDQNVATSECYALN